MPRTVYRIDGKKLAALRAKARMSTTELAGKAGISEPAVRNLEAGIGTQGPRVNTMEAIAAALGMDLAKLIDAIRAKNGKKR